MKTMHGAFFFACAKRSRTRDAPTPTNISTKSDPLIEKNGTPASPATARASSVLPVPGGVVERHLGLVLGERLGARLAEAHDAPAALGLGHDVEEQPEHEDERQHVEQEADD